MEKCYVMVKPGFTNQELIIDVINTIEKRGFSLLDSSFINYDEECARLHYIEKQTKPYVNDLIKYLSSGKAYGMIYVCKNEEVLNGEDTITVIRSIVEQLRKNLPLKYNLKTDIMRNILHCSSKTKVGNTLLELDTQREIAIFNYLKSK